MEKTGCCGIAHQLGFLPGFPGDTAVGRGKRKKQARRSRREYPRLREGDANPYAPAGIHTDNGSSEARTGNS